MTKNPKLEDNFFISPDEFINEFKEAEKKQTLPLKFVNYHLICYGKSQKTKSVEYQLSIMDNEVYGIKFIYKHSKKEDFPTKFKSKTIKFLKSEVDKYFNYKNVVPAIVSDKKPTPLTITKEEFLREFFAEVNEHEIVLIYPPDKKRISFVVPDKNREMVEYSINCSLPVAVGTKSIGSINYNQIKFTNEEVDLYFSFPQQPKEDLVSSEEADKDDYVYEINLSDDYDFIQDLVDLSKKKNTTIVFNEDKLLFTLEHKVNKSKTINLNIEYESEKAIGHRIVNGITEYSVSFTKSEAQSHFFFMNVGLNLSNKLTPTKK